MWEWVYPTTSFRLTFYPRGNPLPHFGAVRSGPATDKIFFDLLERERVDRTYARGEKSTRSRS